ncbi:MAG: RDD family protein [Snowella sp.]|nr:RDD family protein [Snowella sp.]
MRFFNKVSLQTPESVELDFTLAGIGNRAYALVIDLVILGLILIVALIGGALFSYFLYEVIQISNWIPEATLGLWLLAIQLLIMFTIYVGYFVFFETLWQGQTPGKRIVKIRVVRDDSRPIGLPQATLRALLRPIDDFLSLGAFFIIFGKQEKRLGDWLAGTLVIQDAQNLSSEKLKISPEAENLAEILLQDAAIAELLPEDFGIIREYLQRREAMIPQSRRELSVKLAYQAKDLIQLQELPNGISANTFLEAIYLAYQKQFERPDF